MMEDVFNLSGKRRYRINSSISAVSRTVANFVNNNESPEVREITYSHDARTDCFLVNRTGFDADYISSFTFTLPDRSKMTEVQFFSALLEIFYTEIKKLAENQN